MTDRAWIIALWLIAATFAAGAAPYFWRSLP